MDTARETVVALAANLFLQPAVTHALVDYYLASHTPLDEATAPRAQTLLGQLEADTHQLALALALRPIDLVLRAQTGVIGNKPTDRPRVVGVYYWNSSALAVRDDFFEEPAERRTVLTALGVMAADADRYWSNVTHGGMLGNVVASSMRFVDDFAALYSPIVMLATMAHLLLARIAAFVPPAELATQGAALAAAIGRGLRRLSESPDAPIVAALVAVLVAPDAPFVDTQQKVAALVANLDARSRQLYAQLRDGSGASLRADDLGAFLVRHCAPRA